MDSKHRAQPHEARSDAGGQTVGSTAHSSTTATLPSASDPGDANKATTKKTKYNLRHTRDAQPGPDPADSSGQSSPDPDPSLSDTYRPSQEDSDFNSDDDDSYGDDSNDGDDTPREDDTDDDDLEKLEGEKPSRKHGASHAQRARQRDAEVHTREPMTLAEKSRFMQVPPKPGHGCMKQLSVEERNIPPAAIFSAFRRPFDMDRFVKPPRRIPLSVLICLSLNDRAQAEGWSCELITSNDGSDTKTDVDRRFPTSLGYCRGRDAYWRPDILHRWKLGDK